MTSGNSDGNVREALSAARSAPAALKATALRSLLGPLRIFSSFCMSSFFLND